MKHYILVHGAWEGAWSWDKTQPILEQNGHKVTAIDLPGSPGNKQPIEQVTLESYVQIVVDAINALDHNVVLVGHSMAGVVISQVGERIPNKIDELVYVTAFLLENGGSVMEAMQSDPGGEFLPELKFAVDQSYATAAESTWRSKAFHDVSEADILEVLPLMRNVPQASEPFLAKIAVTDKNFGTVRKTYIRTSLDEMISPGFQDKMLENWKVDEIHTLTAGHFPTLSVPTQLAKLLL
jgi:pimeloyl-ACP methyl ester carboxylesterase